MIIKVDCKSAGIRAYNLSTQMSLEYLARERVPEGLKSNDVLNDVKEAADEEARLAAIRS